MIKMHGFVYFVNLVFYQSVYFVYFVASSTNSTQSMFKAFRILMYRQVALMLIYYHLQ